MRTRIPAPVILVLAVTVGFGAFAHRWLALHTKRRVNVGLIAGGLAILLMIVWVGTAPDHLNCRESLREEHRRRIAAIGDQSRDHRAASA